ncbi:hypothetical protein Cgig2_013490 [Carnegiea gigantea]|uniref:Uncharacterized protein n=1 Tax=Carnegiea gigantea TaxID=171969 RepID=A0A9Q1GNI4_9CARY|nr:hypothetical protein Cgig2_013490 [Carnegiea gigantea]
MTLVRIINKVVNQLLALDIQKHLPNLSCWQLNGRGYVGKVIRKATLCLSKDEQFARNNQLIQEVPNLRTQFRIINMLKKIRGSQEMMSLMEKHKRLLIRVSKVDPMNVNFERERPLRRASIHGSVNLAIDGNVGNNEEKFTDLLITYNILLLLTILIN